MASNPIQKINGQGRRVIKCKLRVYSRWKAGVGLHVNSTA